MQIIHLFDVTTNVEIEKKRLQLEIAKASLNLKKNVFAEGGIPARM